MTPNSRLAALDDLGQSIWLDSISREMLESGELDRHVREHSVVGVTSNPSIFQQALASSDAYDEDIRHLVGEGLDDRTIFERLAVADIRDACDALRQVWLSSGRLDGMVSMEVEPDLAHDTDASIRRAHELWNAIDRPNLMIKVPATEAGLPVVEELVFAGINVNVTLLFSVRMYRQVMERYLRGLERRREAGLGPEVHSVASFFVSRVDSAVDPLLDAAGGSARELRGQVAVANALAAWDAYLAVFTSDRFVQGLGSWGALPQRPLWASTSTKDPAYSDLLYVEPLVAAGTVNTMPLATLEAFADHGTAELTITPQAVARAHARLGELREFGIDIDRVTEELLAAGVEAFVDSYADLLAGLGAKRSQLAH